MKKTLILCLTTLLVVTAIVGCEGAGRPKHRCIYKTLSIPHDVFIDPITGVQYIVIDEFGINGGIGITPRLDANGKIMVCEDRKNEIHN